MKLSTASLSIVASIIISGFLIENLSAQTLPGANIIPANRRVDWSFAGVFQANGTKGIPNRTSICADVTQSPYNADKTGTNNAATAIVNALTHCKNSNGVIFIPEGTYAINSSIKFPTVGNLTLRGAGPRKTILKMQSTSIATEQPNELPGGPIASGYSQGSTQITVLNSIDTDNVKVGTLITVHQRNDPALVFTDIRSANPPDQINQVIRVTGVDAANKTISFSPPLAYTFSATFEPQYTIYFGAPPTVYLGIEAMTIDGTLTPSDNVTAELQLYGVYGSWVKNVEFFNTSTTGIFITNSLQTEIRDNFFNAGHGNQDNIGVVLYSDTSSCLVENNIGYDIWVLAGANDTIGSVFSYNYSNNNHPGANQNWPYQSEAYSIHFGHGMMTLWEGNVGAQWHNDGLHGSASHQTLFRNWFNGLHPTFIGNRIMVKMNHFSYYHNLIGNVLGDGSWTPGQYKMTGEPGVYEAPSVIYRLGYPNAGNNGYCTNIGEWNYYDNSGNAIWCRSLSEATGFQKWPGWLDTAVESTALRWGNFDFLHNATQWSSAEIPAGVPVPSTQVLPASLYTSQRPSWWPTSIAWPPIGPDVNGGNAEARFGHVNKVPAQVCFETQNLAQGGIFNPTNCYRNSTLDASPRPPANLRVSI